MMTAMKQIVQLILGKFGLQVVRSATVMSYSLASYFQLLKQLGFSPRHVVDVGANRGMWTKEAMRFFPDSHYTLIEPQDHLKIYVQSLIDAGKVTWINAGASDKEELLPFGISHRDDMSTFLIQQTPVETIQTMKVRTLNEIVSSAGGPPPDMVKIDAEGFDLRVLAGASDLLGKTEIFLVEAILQGNYENTASEVIRRMAAAGYRMMDITTLNRSPKNSALWVMEIAFVSSNSGLIEKMSSYE